MTSARSWYFCLKCGGELPVDARFCARCGYAVSGATPATQVVSGGAIPASSGVRTYPYGTKFADVGGVQLPLAGFGKRLGALVLDWVTLIAAIYVVMIVLIVGLVASAGPDGENAAEVGSGRGFAVATAVITMLMLLVQWSLDSFGWSPGKAASSIRVVRLDGRRPGVVHGLIRYSMRTFSVLFFGLGFLWALWDDRNQTWHDKLAGTVVVRAEPLQEQLANRRPEPLVIGPRYWWLAVASAAIMTASIAFNVWWVASYDSDFFDADPYAPYRRDDGPRIQELDPSRIGQAVRAQIEARGIAPEA